MDKQTRCDLIPYSESKGMFRLLKRFFAALSDLHAPSKNRFSTLQNYHIEISQGLGYPGRKISCLPSKTDAIG